MSDQITVTVVSFGRKFWYMRYKDPLSGKIITKSTGIECKPALKKEAQKKAGEWEAQLRNGKYKPPSKVSWIEFRHRYEDERLPALAPRTAHKVCDVFNSVEKLIGVDKLAKLDASQISRYQQLLRGKKLSEATIKSHLAHLQAALRWAKKVGLLNDVPQFEMPKRVKGQKLMKGRAISGEEFERLLAKVHDALYPQPEKPDDESSPKPDPKPLDAETLARRADAVQRWQWFLRGLWFSGLRLGESLDLSWDEPGHITIDFTDRYPMFLIPGDRQKSGQDQILPLAPEFAEMLLAVPEAERTGRVFKLGRRESGWTPALMGVSKLVSEMGRLAKVVVNRHPLKFASAHDFRRSFGERWSSRVMPAVLQQMMRHADISTTMAYYVGQNANKAAAEIYAAFANSQPKSSAPSYTTPEATSDQSADSPQTESGIDITNGPART